MGMYFSDRWTWHMTIPQLTYLLRSLVVDFILFSLLLYFFSFSFSFIFYFLFLEQLRLGFISHAVTSVTN